MATSAYSGALGRAAHFAFRPPVPGINPEHEHPDPDPDPFQPAPPGATSAPGDVWQPQDLPMQTDMRVGARPHTTPLQPPVPSNVHSEQRDEAAKCRMLDNHAVVDYRPDSSQIYRHATQGMSVAFLDGRPPQNAGAAVPEDVSYLMAGRNSYDLTNQPNEVYAGGRYRLGTEIREFGLYDQPGKYGQDAQLRAYTGLQAQFPVDKPRVPDSAPYTPNSSGTTTWTTPAFRIPTFFGTPSETSVTDYEADTTGDYFVPGEFDDGGRL